MPSTPTVELQGTSAQQLSDLQYRHKQPAHITVPRGGMICLNNVCGKTLRVVSGSVSITQEDDNGDIALTAGEWFCIARSGLVVVNACQNAAVTSVMLEAPLTILHLLMRSLRRVALPARRGLRSALAGLPAALHGRLVRDRRHPALSGEGRAQRQGQLPAGR